MLIYKSQALALERQFCIEIHAKTEFNAKESFIKIEREIQQN